MFNITFSESDNFNISFGESDGFAVGFGDVITVTEGEHYSGAYAVTPRLYPQYLDTDGKIMSDDVTVYEIPVTQTSNPYGGQTVLIG